MGPLLPHPRNTRPVMRIGSHAPRSELPQGGLSEWFRTEADKETLLSRMVAGKKFQERFADSQGLGHHIQQGLIGFALFGRLGKPDPEPAVRFPSKLIPAGTGRHTHRDHRTLRMPLPELHTLFPKIERQPSLLSEAVPKLAAGQRPQTIWRFFRLTKMPILWGFLTVRGPLGGGTHRLKMEFRDSL